MTSKHLLIATLLAAFATHMALATQNVPQAAAETGTLQGTVTCDGATDPIPDVQIAVFGKSYGRPAMSTQLAQEMLDDPTKFRINIDNGTGRVDRSTETELSPETLQQARDTIANGSRGGTPLPALTAVTDSNGHFSIANVPVGETNVRALGEGYFAPAASGGYSPIASKTVTVTAEKTTAVQISLLPGGSISGRATDSNGKPLSDLQVFVLQASYTDGRPTLHLANSKSTDDRGEYRMYRLSPGEYFIAVLPRPGFRGAPVAAGEIPVKTFYPGVADQARAVPIVLKSGDDLLGVNMQLTTGAVATISGRVTTTLPAVPLTNGRGAVREMIPSISMTPHEPDALSDFSGGRTITANAADGTFQIPGVAPGIYDLFARLPIAYGWGAANPPERAATAWAIGRTTVEVRGTNVDNVVIAVNPGVDVKGRITVDGRPSVPNLRLILQSVGSEGVPGELLKRAQLKAFVRI